MKTNIQEVKEAKAKLDQLFKDRDFSNSMVYNDYDRLIIYKFYSAQIEKYNNIIDFHLMFLNGKSYTINL